MTTTILQLLIEELKITLGAFCTTTKLHTIVSHVIKKSGRTFRDIFADIWYSHWFTQWFTTSLKQLPFQAALKTIAVCVTRHHQREKRITWISFYLQLGEMTKLHSSTLNFLSPLSFPPFWRTVKLCKSCYRLLSAAIFQRMCVLEFFLKWLKNLLKQ